MTESHDNPPGGLRESATFDRNVIHEIQRAAQTGIYDIRGWGAKGREHVALPAGRVSRAL